jgi:hypothetical protein
MCQAIAEVVRHPLRKDLRLVLQPAKGTRMYYSVAVPLEFVPVWMRRLRITASLRRAHWETQALNPR